MQSIRAPRKPSGGVDVQLNEFEDALRATLMYNLMYRINRYYWNELDEIDRNDLQGITNAIDLTFIDFRYAYRHAPVIINILNNAQILIQNVTWAAMNVPYPANPDSHVDRVIDNTLEVYWREVYAPLRTEMILANHAVGLVQRTWRRCVTDPTHPACRRRLEFEFKNL